MENVIICACEAVKTSQKVNRENWLRLAGAKLSKQIMTAAATGVRELHVNFKDLLVGAENLYEAGEMFAYLNEHLEKSGYKNTIEPSGILHINW
jgi:hypothetical protein